MPPLQIPPNRTSLHVDCLPVRRMAIVRVLATRDGHLRIFHNPFGFDDQIFHQPLRGHERALELARFAVDAQSPHTRHATPVGGKCPIRHHGARVAFARDDSVIFPIDDKGCPVVYADGVLS